MAPKRARRSQTFRHHFTRSTECLYTTTTAGSTNLLQEPDANFTLRKRWSSTYPPDTVPVTKTTNAAIAGFHGFARKTEFPPPDPPQTMADLLTDIPEWKQAYMRDLTTSIDIEKILLTALLKGTLTMCRRLRLGIGSLLRSIAPHPRRRIHWPLKIWHHITPHGSLRLPWRTFRYRPIDQDPSPGMDPIRNQAIAQHPLLLR
jgi:hypothetical protein